MSRARTLAGAIGSDGALNVADVAGLAAVASSGSASDLSTGTLPIARIADGAVTSAKIADGTIVNGDLASGVAVANLGYTPVNKAGDTMTGPLGVGVFTHASNSGEARLGRADDRSVGVATLQLGGTSPQKFEVVDKGWSSVLFSVTDAGAATVSGSLTSNGLNSNSGLQATNGLIFTSSGNGSCSSSGTFLLNIEGAAGLYTNGLLMLRGNENGVNQTIRVYMWNISYYGPTGARYVGLKAISSQILNNGYGDVYAYLPNFSGSYTNLDQTNAGTTSAVADVYIRNAVGANCTYSYTLWRTG